MTTMALVLFAANLEASGAISLLEAFDPALDCRIVDDVASTLTVIAQAGPDERVDWLLVDVDHLGGAIEAGLIEVRQVAPQLQVVAFGRSVATADIERWMSLGARAYIPRSISRQATIAILHLVRAGERFRPISEETGGATAEDGAGSPGIKDTLARFGLTPAEHEVLVLASEGRTNLQIAIERGRREGTVHNQMSAILRKLGVTNRSEAIGVAMREKTVIDAHLQRVRDNPQNLSWMYPHMAFRRHRKGHMLFREGDVGREMFIVRQGRVSLPQLGREMTENDLFGEIAIFAPHNRRTASARCETDVALFAIGSDRVMQLCYLNPAFALSMLEIVVERLLRERGRAR